ncbi:Armadillo repeat-containing protein 5 [Amphibalanus amphitrite]|uniref:Armadillo repeat-containing protein 5 n=1 Tax=Amphibalanus amphitrite TaxID=1232801 RepID=A0A6A4W5C2_AMPAM|nr:Armadillo repeat-containing protein 5 [Amphibalanus amphitrite]
MFSLLYQTADALPTAHSARSTSHLWRSRHPQTMGRADVERVVRQLGGQLALPQLLSVLVEVRKRVISTRPGLEEFVRQGGLTPLTELLKQPQPADVFNVTLSILGNCTARPAGRQHFVQHGGIHAVLNVLQLVADAEVANRACRTLANLAQEPALCRTLLQEDTLDLVQSLMAVDQPPPPPDELKTTVFRLWRLLADRDSHRRRLLRTECLVTVAGALGSQNRQLVRESLRTLAHFAAGAARETGAQMQQSAEAMPSLLRLCGAECDSGSGSSSDTSGGRTESGAESAADPPPLRDPELAVSAFRLALTLAQESSLRPTLGQLGFLQLLWEGIHGAAAADASGETSGSRSESEETPTDQPGAGNAPEGRLQTTEKSEKKRGPPGASDGGSGAGASDGRTGDKARHGHRTDRPPTDGAETDQSDSVSVTSVTSSVDRSSLVSALCLFCWESVNRARFRSLGYLPWLVRVLGACGESESLRHRVLHALFQFVYDDTGFGQMKRAGLIAVLVGRLQALVAGWEREGRSGDQRCCRRSVSPVSSEDSEDGNSSDGSGYRADSPTYRQVEREIESYLQQVRRAEPAAERLFKSFSPTDSLASSPLRSPDVSPPGWSFSARSPRSASPSGSWSESQFSPPVSPGGWQFSPPVSPAPGGSLSPPLFPGGGRFSPSVSPASSGPQSPMECPGGGQWSPQVSPRGGDSRSPPQEDQPSGEFSPQISSGGGEMRSPSVSSSYAGPPSHSPPLRSPSSGSAHRPSKRRRLYSAEVSSEPASRRGDEHSWLLLLLSRESQAEKPDRQLASADCCRALVDCLRLAPQPQPRAARILARIGRNPYCFRPLVCQRLAWLCVSSLSREQAQPALSGLQAVAHSGYGQGVLESLMELGGDTATSAVITAAVVVSLQTSLRRLLLRRRGLDLLLDELVSDADDRSGPAAGALAALCRHLAPNDRPPSSEATETSSPCRYVSEPLPPDLTLVLSDGEVAARRDRLAAGSPVLGALLTGGFREASTQRVPLGELSREVAAPLVHIAYGCGAGCRLLSRLPARLWLPLLAAADRFLLAEAAESLGGRVLAARRPERLAALYRAARSQPLQLEGAAGWGLQLLLLRRLLAAGPRRAADPLRLLLREHQETLLADLRAVVGKLLEPTAA